MPLDAYDAFFSGGMYDALYAVLNSDTSEKIAAERVGETSVLLKDGTEKATLSIALNTDGTVRWNYRLGKDNQEITSP